MSWIKTGVALAAVAAGFVAAAPLINGPASGQTHHVHLSAEARTVAIRRAQVWRPTDVPSMDLKTGPQGPGAFAPSQTVTCDYVKKVMNGRTPKFACRVAPGDEVKVKYGNDNGEVYAEVAATRLLWALGFPVDRMYPVRVICRGCSADPFKDTRPTAGPGGPGGNITFDPAAIERELEGEILETSDHSGWAWPELDLVEETVGGAPRAHRDALKLLAVMMQHTDSKPEQQRLMCSPGEKVQKPGDGTNSGKDIEPCLHTIMMIDDLGKTFGHSSVYNRQSIASVSFEQWSRAKVWSDPRACEADLSRSQTGTLDHPRISEAGRKFLADLLVQLTDAQLHDMFEVARFPERTGAGRPASVDEWVGAFKQKRDEIVNHACPLSSEP